MVVYMKKKLNYYYCEKCGHALFDDIMPAEKYHIYVPYPHDTELQLYTSYDKETGKKQYLRHWYCPNRGWWIFNSHTDFVDEELILVDPRK